MTTTNWVRLTSYSVPYMADVLRGALVANGIEAMLFNAHASSILPHLSQIIPVDVMVKEKDLEEARKLLNEFESSAEPPPSES